MWPFKKQKEDLDLTILAKRGLLKIPKAGDVDLTQSSSPITSDSLGFLSSMASSAEPSSSSSLGSNKIDDIEYKLESMIRRLNSMIDRVDLMEKKVDRLERHEL